MVKKSLFCSLISLLIISCSLTNILSTELVKTIPSLSSQESVSIVPTRTIQPTETLEPGSFRISEPINAVLKLYHTPWDDTSYAGNNVGMNVSLDNFMTQATFIKPEGVSLDDFVFTLRLAFPDSELVDFVINQGNWYIENRKTLSEQVGELPDGVKLGDETTITIYYFEGIIYWYVNSVFIASLNHGSQIPVNSVIAQSYIEHEQEYQANGISLDTTVKNFGIWEVIPDK